MKKIVLTISIILGLALTGMAQLGGGMFQRGDDMIENNNNYRTENSPMLPTDHGSGNDHPASPLGTGIAVLATFGAAYAFSKTHRRK